MINTSLIDFLTKGYAFDLVVSILVGLGLYSLYVNVISEALGVLIGGLDFSVKSLPLGRIPDGLSIEQARETGFK